MRKNDIFFPHASESQVSHDIKWIIDHDSIDYLLHSHVKVI